MSITSRINKTITSKLNQQKTRFGNSKSGTAVAEYLEKDFNLNLKPKHLLPPLKWAGIGIGAYIADAAILGAAADGLVKSIQNAVHTIKGLPPSDLAGPGWYLTHPFMTSWIFWRHMLGAPINVTPICKTWIGLNILCALGLAVRVAYKKYAISESDQDRDIKKVRFKKVKFDIEREIERTPDGQVFLGLDDQRQPIQGAWHEMNKHTHILGGAGTGKTSFAVVPICLQAIRAGMCVIAIDFKGDAQAIQLLAREAKKATKKFYLFSLQQKIKSNSYNPLAQGGGALPLPLCSLRSHNPQPRRGII